MLQVRFGQAPNLFASYNFSTFAGFRPAEPSTVSLVATHSLLTHLLLFTMNHNFSAHHGGGGKLGGSSYEVEEVQELHGFHSHHINAVRAITGVDQAGSPKRTEPRAHTYTVPTAL